jgi:hypothetical protein
MSSGSRLTFRGITRGVFRQLKKTAARHGIPVCSHSGEATKDGISIQWNYDPDTESLEVACIRAPFWIDMAQVNRKLCEEIESTLGSPKIAA